MQIPNLGRFGIKPSPPRLPLLFISLPDKTVEFHILEPCRFSPRVLPFSDLASRRSPRLGTNDHRARSMWSPKVQYSITRNITIPYFTPILCVLGFVWIGIITLLNIAAIGYDSVTQYSTSFNNSKPLWYERFALTKSVFPASWSCSPSVNLGQS